MKAFIGLMLVMVFAAAAFGLVALLLWLLIPLAFPLLTFDFWNALALAAIVLLFGVPATISSSS